MKVDVADVAFHQRLGRLFERLGSGQFWNALAELLHSAVQFDNWVAMVYSPSTKPRLIRVSRVLKGTRAIRCSRVSG